MLLPETRRSANHIEALLAEVKIMTSTDHPHILSLVGVAWDVLADICMVSEYMEGGDLRALLASYEDENHPLGFDRQKLTIAVHVAHALAYLHSFAPLVLHQNLKSTNILLSADLGAKISSFGLDVVEHIECTMTEDLRSHVWTAPEVLMGERYDASADIYSFGVVLSELDQHVIPHSSPNDELGQQPTDLAMKQNAILCKLQVRYASTASSIAALRSSCISLVPDDRPTAAEVLYNLRKMIHQLDEAVAGSW
ncbi:hypothetical protein ON010_g12780 [Phytophthora cinnamomi]|nr:hypothetical protein ON010_g12780 [Phytophthora cinnamomi]